MKNITRQWLGLGLIALALPMAASAQEAYTRRQVTLYAGPAAEYPQVARLPPGQELQVVGCTNGYGWCDIVLPDGLRGWVYASELEYPYAGNPVPLAAYGAMIGVPIIGFSLGNYWSDHYRDRPWYQNRRWWGNRPPPPPMPGWRPPPPVVGWQPRPPAPGWSPPPPRPAPGWNHPGAQPGWNHPGPGGPGHDWNGRPQRPPVAVPQPRPPGFPPGGPGRPPGSATIEPPRNVEH